MIRYLHALPCRPCASCNREAEVEIVFGKYSTYEKRVNSASLFLCKHCKHSLAKVLELLGADANMADSDML